MSRREREAVRALAFAVLVAAAGCRQDMHDQPRIDPLAENRFFADGSGARPIPANTVARGQLRENTPFETGQAEDGSLLAASPLPVTRALLVRGRDRFEVFCAPCHGRTGEGDGMVVRRGYKQPSSYHVDRLRMAPAGYFYYVMSNGFGVMPSYAAQISPADRWAIVAYLRTLQLSRHFDAAKLSADELARLDAAPETGAQAHAGH